MPPPAGRFSTRLLSFREEFAVPGGALGECRYIPVIRQRGKALA